jgi:hypothetical protein
MNKKTSIIGGVILILLGGLFLTKELLPDLFSFWDWPFFIIGVGALFILWAILSGIGGLAVPGAIISGIGGILYYQNMTGDWTSWSYIWALIPGFVGIGVIFANIIDGKFKKALSEGFSLLLISAVLFFAFGNFFGLQNDIAQYWPVLLILLGIIALVKAIRPSKKKKVSVTIKQESTPEPEPKPVSDHPTEDNL